MKIIAHGVQNTLIQRYRYGINKKVVGKTDPNKLSYSGCWQDSQGTLQDLAAHIGKGHPWMPSLLDGNRKRWQTNANYAELLSLDIDEGLTIQEAMAHPLIAKHCGLGIESSSSQPDHHKFRLVFPLATPIEGSATIKVCNTYLQQLIGVADPACKDASRFYFGGLGRTPFLMQDVTLPADFVDQALAWQKAIDRAKAEEQRKRAEERLSRLERLAPGDIDPESLIEQANDRLGADAFLRYLESEKHSRGDKIRVKPAFRKGSGSYSAFLSQTHGLWLYHDPSGGHSCDGFRFYVWQSRGDGYKPRGAEFWELLRGYCSLANIEVPEFKPCNTIQRTNWDKKEIESTLKNPWDGEIDIVARGRDELERILLAGGDACIISPTAAGKSEALSILAKDHAISHIAVAPLRSLTYGLAGILDLAVFNDGLRRELDDRVAVVINSLHKVRPLRGFNLYCDEFEQSLDSLYRGPLNRKDRHGKAQGSEQKIREADRLFSASATALPRDLEKLEGIRGRRSKRILYQPDHGHQKASIIMMVPNGEKGSYSTALSLGISALESDIKAGKRAIISCDTESRAIELGILAQHWGVDPASILIYSLNNLEDDRAQAFRKASDKGAWLAESGIKFLAYSPIMVSGDSIKDPQGAQLFDSRYAFVDGSTYSPAQALQAVNRYRSSLPINAIVARRGRYVPVIRGRAKDLSNHAQKLGSWLDDGGKGFAIDEYALENDRILAMQYRQFAQSFQIWAERDGHSVEVDEIAPAKIDRLNVSEAVKDFKARPILAAEPLNDAQYRLLAAKPEPTIKESYQIKAYQVRKYHGLKWDAPLSLELIKIERFGKGSKEFSRLLNLAIDGYAADLDRQDREELGDVAYLQDLPYRQKRLELWHRLGVIEILEYCLTHRYSQNDPTLRAWWDELWQNRHELFRFPKLLGFSLTPPKEGESFYKPMIRIIGSLLRSLGFKTQSSRSRGDDLARTYWVSAESIEDVAARLSRFLEESGLQPRSIALISILLRAMDHGAAGAKIPENLRAKTPDLPPLMASHRGHNPR